MALKAGELQYDIIANLAPLKKDLTKAEGQVKGTAARFGGYFKSIGTGLKNAITPILRLGGLFIGLTSILIIVKSIKKVIGDMFKAIPLEKQKQLLAIFQRIKVIWTEFLGKMGGPIFDAVIKGAGDLLGWIERIRSEGKLDEWAGKIGSAVATAIGFINNLVTSVGAGDFSKVGELIGNALSDGLMRLLSNKALIGQIATFGFNLGKALIQAFWSGLKSFVISPKDIDRKKNPLLWFIFNGGFGEWAGEGFNDFRDSNLNPANMRF